MEMTQADKHRLIDEFASAIKARKLEAPVIFLLEMHKPLFGLAQVVTTLSMPLLVAIIGVGKAKRLEELLEDRDNIEFLLRQLENPKQMGGA